jgi:hypothetical protein
LGGPRQADWEVIGELLYRLGASRSAGWETGGELLSRTASSRSGAWGIRWPRGRESGGSGGAVGQGS